MSRVKIDLVYVTRWKLKDFGVSLEEGDSWRKWVLSEAWGKASKADIRWRLSGCEMVGTGEHISSPFLK